MASRAEGVSPPHAQLTGSQALAVPEKCLHPHLTAVHLRATIVHLEWDDRLTFVDGRLTFADGRCVRQTTVARTVPSPSGAVSRADGASRSGSDPQGAPRPSPLPPTCLGDPSQLLPIFEPRRFLN